MKKAHLIAVIFVSAGLLFSCTDNQRRWLGRFFKLTGSAIPVAVENVVVQERPSSVIVPATLAPSEQMDVRLSEEAHIERVMVNVGDAVKAGDVLCRLSAEDVNLKLASLRADLRELQSTLEKNTYFLRNRDRLLEEGRIDRTQFDNLDAEVDANESAIEKTKSQISLLEAQTGNVNVTSPISGIVQARYASPGLVIAEKQPLFSIMNINPISINFALAPYEAKAVKAGMPVTVRFRELPGESVAVNISSVGAQINPETGRFDVRALLSNPNGTYKIGMTAQVEFEGAEKQKFFTVPDEAVIVDRRRQFVFTVSMGVAHKVPVIVREIKDGRAEIIDGLVESDLVVVKGNKELKEGSVVEIWGR